MTPTPEQVEAERERAHVLCGLTCSGWCSWIESDPCHGSRCTNVATTLAVRAFEARKAALQETLDLVEEFDNDGRYSAWHRQDGAKAGRMTDPRTEYSPPATREPLPPQRPLTAAAIRALWYDTAPQWEAKCAKGRRR